MHQQDSFSNLSFHSDQNAYGGSSTVGHYDGEDQDSPGVPQQERDNIGDPNLQQLDAAIGGEILECTVSEPHTENTGTKDAYVSYLITTNVSSPEHCPYHLRHCHGELTCSSIVHLLHLSKTSLLRSPPLHRLRFPFKYPQQRLPSMRRPASPGQEAHGVRPRRPLRA